MHILATFATLCCQTRWPRNHSCTTQEHVSFFRDIFGHFRKFRLFSTFSQKPSKCSKTVRTWEKHNFTCSTILQKRIHKCTHVEKCFHVCKTFLQMCKRQMCKSANVRKTVVHKMRKSAAQIIFQMQKSQICTVHKFTNATFCACHNFVCAQFRQVQICVYVYVKKFCVTN